MSFAAIYTLEFPDFFDRDIQVLIEDESGDANVDIKASDNPVTVEFSTPSDFILDPINGSTITLRLMSETDYQFIGLYTNSNRKYRVTLKINTVLQGRWFMQPDQYQEDYKQTPYVTEFIAADQLGFLKTVAWDRRAVETEMVTLGAILKKTNLDLDLYEAINVYEDGQDETTADSPLDQTYINTKVFTGMTYYDALKGILFKYGAVIKQVQGKWVIYRPEDATAAYQRRLWTYSAGVFTYDSTASHNPVVLSTSATVTRANLVRVTNGGMFINPAWKKYQLVQNYGKIKNILENGNFETWNLGIPTGWEKFGSFLGNIHEGNAVKMLVNTSTTGQLSQTFYSPLESRWRCEIEWDVHVVAGTAMKLDFLIFLKNTAGYLFTYDFDIEGWSPGSTSYQLEYDNTGGSESFNQTGSVNVVTTAHTAAGVDYMSFVLHNPAAARPNGSYVKWKSVKISMMDEQDGVVLEYENDNIQDIEINPSNNFNGGSHEMLLNDVGRTYTKFVCKGGMWLDAAQFQRTTEWVNSSGRGKLEALLKNSIGKLLSKSQQVISVPIYSKLLSASSVIQEINNDNKLFLIKRGAWDILNGIWDVEAFEIGQGVGAILRDEGVPLLDEGEVMPDE